MDLSRIMKLSGLGSETDYQQPDNHSTDGTIDELKNLKGNGLWLKTRAIEADDI